MRQPKQIVESGNVEVHLPEIFGFEYSPLYFKRNNALQLAIEEKQIDKIFLFFHIERDKKITKKQIFK